ncbi:hypothetical protein CK203_024546 [Vitis vinifera]|uniref:Uncharacterized protein n=1 Tax=Vitis vinifera TaxID=29760 RepID=A0A438IVF8_VITVI|nr:hypothetical protein CK203_024546 [Vitis vinifera]
MALFAAMSYTPLSLSLSRLRPPTNHRRFSPCLASVSSSSHESSPPPPPPSPPTETILSSNPPSKPLVESSRPLNSTYNYALPDPRPAQLFGLFVTLSHPLKGGVSGTLIPSPCGIDVRFYNHHVYYPLWVLCKYNILVMFDMCFEPHASMTPLSLPMGLWVKTLARLDRFPLWVIFDFRFLALLAVGGSLAGSLLCFLNGCVYIVDAYKVYWTSCVKGIHTGKMVLRLVEAIDVYLAGTVMLIFGMGLYGLFISNVPPDVPPSVDRALKGSSLFGMFALKERPKWMKISSLDELKTKVGHVIVMILLVKMFERSKMVTIATGMDLLSYSVCIFLSSASLYILNNLHKAE